eukprot:5788244-Prymnesium_polylepis.1
MLALNISTGSMEKVPHVHDEEDSYTTIHRPRKEPYAGPRFKQRFIWEMETEAEAYVVWIIPWRSKDKAHMIRFSDLEEETTKEDVGDMIEDYRFDQAIYDAAASAAKSGAGGSRTTTTTTAVQVVTKRTVTTSTSGKTSVSSTSSAKRAKVSNKPKASESEARTEAERDIFGSDDDDDVPAPMDTEKYVLTKEDDVASSSSAQESVNKTWAAPAAGATADVAGAVETSASTEGEEKDVAESVLDMTLASSSEADHDASASASAAAAIDEEADVESDQVAALKKQIADSEEARERAEFEAAEAKRLHENHKKRKAAEKKKMDAEKQTLEEELKARPSQADMDALRARLAQRKAGMSAKDYEQSEDAKKSATECMEVLLDMCTAALDKQIADKMPVDDGSYVANEFEFVDDQGSWSAITDNTVLTALRQVVSTGNSSSYTFGSHNYTASLAAKPKGKGGQLSYDIDQKNTTTGAVRRVRIPANHGGSKASFVQASAAKAAEILFDSSTLINLKPDVLNALIDEYRFGDVRSEVFSLKLAQLAEKFSSLACGF